MVGGCSERKAGARSRCALRAKFRILRVYHQGSGGGVHGFVAGECQEPVYGSRRSPVKAVKMRLEMKRLERFNSMAIGRLVRGMLER